MCPLKAYNLLATAIIVILCAFCYYLHHNSSKSKQQQTFMYIELLKANKDLKETEDLLRSCDEKYNKLIVQYSR